MDIFVVSYTLSVWCSAGINSYAENPQIPSVAEYSGVNPRLGPAALDNIR